MQQEKEEDLAWIKAYGHKGININQIDKNLSEFDVIINTVPQMILTAEKIRICKTRMFVDRFSFKSRWN